MYVVVRCVDCGHFSRDTEGDGLGIGDCAEFDAFIAKQPSVHSLDNALREVGGKSFWPLAERCCDWFIDNNG